MGAWEAAVVPRPSPQTDRVIAVIELLAASERGATMTEIARSLDLSQATCVHLLAALTTAGFLFREPEGRRYHLGPALAHPGRVAAERYPVLAAARPEMVALSAQVGLPCFALELDRGHARLVHHTWAPGSSPTPVRLGETLPLNPPLGLVFVAWGPDEDFDAWLASDAEKWAGREQQYRAARAAVREFGFVVELAPDAVNSADLAGTLDERPSPYRDGRLHRLLSAHGDRAHILTDLSSARTYAVSAIGAPVIDGTGRVVLSLSLAAFPAPLSGSTIRELGTSLRSSANAVAASLP